MEAWSINCILVYISLYAANRNLLTIAWLMAKESEGRTDSLPAHYVEYLLLLRLMLLIHLIRRTPEEKKLTLLKDKQTMNFLEKPNP
jgi:hypothetical protein